LKAGLIIEKIEKETGIKMLGVKEGLNLVKERLYGR